MSDSKLSVLGFGGKDSFEDGGDFLGNMYTELTCVPEDCLVSLLLLSSIEGTIEEDTVTTVPVESTVELGESLAMFVNSRSFERSYTGVLPASRWRTSP